MTEPERPVADWPQDEPWAQVAETHASVVFLAGDRACKLKKPVNLGFLDFSTAEARAAACAREVELNRKFAPDVYLGVAEIRGPDGRVCDHLVLMHRMPAARRLSTLVRSRAQVAGPLRQVARIIAAQHAEAASGPHIAEQGSRDALRRRWADNIEQTRKIQARLAPREPLDPAVIDQTERLASRFLAGRARFSTPGSARAASSTGTVTCSPTTSSASTTGRGSWTAWTSMTGSAGWTGSMTSRSWPWTWNGSAPRSWRNSSWPPTPTTRGTRHRHPCGIITWPTGPSSASRSPACGSPRTTWRPASRRATWPR